MGQAALLDISLILSNVRNLITAVLKLTSTSWSNLCSWRHEGEVTGIYDDLRERGLPAKKFYPHGRKRG
jgi:hypothetical protein